MSRNELPFQASFILGMLLDVEYGKKLSQKEHNLANILASENNIVNGVLEIKSIEDSIKDISDEIQEKKFINPQINELDKSRLSRNSHNLSLNQMKAYFNLKSSLTSLKNRLVEKREEQDPNIAYVKTILQNIYES